MLCHASIETFLDDNIGHGLGNFMDARDAKTGEPLVVQVRNCELSILQQCLRVALYLIAALHQGAE